MLDPRKDAVLIQRAAVQQPGYGASAPSAIALDGGATAVVVRVDEPATRSSKVRIAEAPDGLSYQMGDTWRTQRKDVSDPRNESGRTPALGRFCVRRTLRSGAPRPAFSLYASARRPDGTWCISGMDANSLASFRPQDARPVVMPEDLDASGVRDPWVLEEDGVLYLYAACELVATSPASAG